MSIQPLEFSQGATWVVTRQEPDAVSYATPGEPVYGVNIYFQTAAGNSGTIFVPYIHYPDVKATHAALARAARLADQVSALTSRSFPG